VDRPNKGMNLVESYPFYITVDNASRNRIGTKLVVVPKTTDTELDMTMYQSGHVVPNSYFLEPKWYVPNVMT